MEELSLICGCGAPYSLVNGKRDKVEYVGYGKISKIQIANDTIKGHHLLVSIRYLSFNWEPYVTAFSVIDTMFFKWPDPVGLEVVAFLWEWWGYGGG